MMPDTTTEMATPPSFDATAAGTTLRDAAHMLAYQGPPPNPSDGGANLAILATTTQFYRQDTLTGPNLTHPDANLAQLRTTLQ